MIPTTLRAPLIFAPRNVLDPSQDSEFLPGSDCSHEKFPSHAGGPTSWRTQPIPSGIKNRNEGAKYVE
jgi:hypothetical protein